MKEVSIDCRDVIQEISNFIEGEVTQELRERMQAHLAGCAHCLAIFDGTRNIIRLVGDGEVFELPGRFGERLRSRIEGLYRQP